MCMCFKELFFLLLWTDVLLTHLAPFICWSPNPTVTAPGGKTCGGVMRVRGGHKCGALIQYGTNALIRGPPELFPPCETTVRRQLSARQKGRLTRNQTEWNLDLDLASLQNTIEKTILLFKLPSQWYFVMATQAN